LLADTEPSTVEASKEKARKRKKESRPEPKHELEQEIGGASADSRDDRQRRTSESGSESGGITSADDDTRLATKPAAMETDYFDLGESDQGQDEPVREQSEAPFGRLAPATTTTVESPEAATSVVGFRGGVATMFQSAPRTEVFVWRDGGGGGADNVSVAGDADTLFWPSAPFAAWTANLAAGPRVVRVEFALGAGVIVGLATAETIGSLRSVSGLQGSTHSGGGDSGGGGGGVIDIDHLALALCPCGSVRPPLKIEPPLSAPVGATSPASWSPAPTLAAPANNASTQSTPTATVTVVLVLDVAAKGTGVVAASVAVARRVIARGIVATGADRFMSPVVIVPPGPANVKITWAAEACDGPWAARNAIPGSAGTPRLAYRAPRISKGGERPGGLGALVRRQWDASCAELSAVAASASGALGLALRVCVLAPHADLVPLLCATRFDDTRARARWHGGSLAVDLVVADRLAAADRIAEVLLVPHEARAGEQVVVVVDPTVLAALIASSRWLVAPSLTLAVRALGAVIHAAERIETRGPQGDHANLQRVRRALVSHARGLLDTLTQY
jgi:hypothetical protein